LFSCYQDEAVNLIYKYRETVKNNIIVSLLIFTLAHLIGSILLIPGAPFGIGSGIIFGTIFDGNFLGYFFCVFFYVSVQGMAGVVVFNISNCLFKEKIRKYFIETNEKLKKLDKVLSKFGTKAIFLFRLSPLVPTTIFNYIMGGFNSRKFNLY